MSPHTPPADPSYGRLTAPLYKWEKELDAQPGVTTSRFITLVGKDGESTGEVYLVTLQPEDLAKANGRPWTFFTVWEKAPAVEGHQREGDGIDVLAIHGLFDRGGRWSKQIGGLLDKGYRVVAVDLPGHGRSCGLLGMVEDEKHLPAAVQSVLISLSEEGVSRKTYLIGHSMGGWTALAYPIFYPPTTTTPTIAGIFALAPYVGVVSEALPNAFVKNIGLFLKRYIPTKPLVHVVAGRESDNPEVGKEFREDPLTYKGKVRIATGSVLLGMVSPSIFTNDKAISKITVPVRIIHGNKDRVCLPEASVQLIDRLKELGVPGEKECELKEGYEHVMHPYGYNGLGGKWAEQREGMWEDLEGWLRKQVVNASPAA